LYFQAIIDTSYREEHHLKTLLRQFHFIQTIPSNILHASFITSTDEIRRASSGVICGIQIDEKGENVSDCHPRMVLLYALIHSTSKQFPYIETNCLSYQPCKIKSCHSGCCDWPESLRAAVV